MISAMVFITMLNITKEGIFLWQNPIRTDFFFETSRRPCSPGRNTKNCHMDSHVNTILVGGFNPSEKYESQLG